MSDAPELPVDALGQEITDPQVAAVFARRPEIDTMVETLGELAARLRQASRDDDPLYCRCPCGEIVRVLGEVCTSLRDARPFCIAPDHVHERLREHGWLTQKQMSRAEGGRA